MNVSKGMTHFSLFCQTSNEKFTYSVIKILKYKNNHRKIIALTKSPANNFIFQFKLRVCALKDFSSRNLKKCFFYSLLKRLILLIINQEYASYSNYSTKKKYA